MLIHLSPINDDARRLVSQERDYVGCIDAVRSALNDFKRMESQSEGRELLSELSSHLEMRGWGIHTGQAPIGVVVSTDILDNQVLCSASSGEAAVPALMELLRSLGTEPRLQSTDIQGQLDELEEIFRVEHSEAGEFFLEHDDYPGEYGFWTEEYILEVESRKCRM